MKAIFQGWNFFRTLRLVLGVGILVYGYSEMDWLLMMIGSAFSVMAIANTACGPFASNCQVDYKDKEKDGAN